MLHKATLKGYGEVFLFATARFHFKGFSRVLSFSVQKILRNKGTVVA